VSQIKVNKQEKQLKNKKTTTRSVQIIEGEKKEKNKKER